MALTPATLVLLRAFLESNCGGPLEGLAPLRLSSDDVAAALWPLNDLFRPQMARVREQLYRPSFEAAADVAIERFVAAPVAGSWSAIEAGTWRVLLERHLQALTLVMAGDAGMTVPAQLPRAARTGAAMLFLLHQMKLPWPAADRSHFELPPGAVPGSLTLQ